MGATEMAITVSEKALNEIRRIQSRDPGNTNAALRVRVVGGGCSGMSYKMDFESTPPSADDHVVERDGVRVVVDKKSMLFLNGTELDFSDGLNGKGFEFHNPQAKRTCGCGSSFST
jgi:iron-sulfur cluster assembly protein